MEGVPDLRCVIYARQTPVPVYVLQDLIDLKCCIAGQTYRAGVVIQNRGKVALKCRLKVRPELEEFLEFLPKLGFCQAQKSFTFNLKFVPRIGMLNTPALQKFFVERDLFEVPMQISVADQVMYTGIFFSKKQPHTETNTDTVI